MLSCLEKICVWYLLTPHSIALITSIDLILNYNSCWILLCYFFHSTWLLIFLVSSLFALFLHQQCCKLLLLLTLHNLFPPIYSAHCIHCEFFTFPSEFLCGKTSQQVCLTQPFLFLFPLCISIYIYNKRGILNLLIMISSVVQSLTSSVYECPISSFSCLFYYNFVSPP